MNIKYPSFVTPGSGKISYNEYEFARYTNHIGVYNHMDWTPPEHPSSYYHPYYIHNINDGLLAQRDPVNAASMEMGVGSHIAAIAQYVNSHNLGLPNKRIGVSYFNQVGVSGVSNWWTAEESLNNTIVNSGVIIDNLYTDKTTIVSGYFTFKSQMIIPQSNTTVSLYSTGSSYLSNLKSNNNKWLFDYGNIYLENLYIKLFDDTFILNLTSGHLSCNDNISFSGCLSVRNLILNEGVVSGVFDSYLKNTSSDSLVTYDNTTGHTHDAGGFSDIFQDEEIVGNTIFDNIYYYSVGKEYILQLDSRSENMTWVKYNAVSSTNNARVFKDDSTPYVIPSDINIKAASINGLSLQINIGSDIINLSDERTYTIDGVALNSDEFYFIDNILYFVHSNGRMCFIYKFNGTIWNKYTYALPGIFINSCVSSNEIFINFSLGSKFGVTRFNNVGNFKPITSYQTFGIIKQVLIKDHHLVASFININNLIDVYIYNTNTSKYQLLFNDIDINNSSLSIYHNNLYFFVQVGMFKKYITLNKSTSLSLDSVDGIIFTEKEININGNLKSKSVIRAMTKTSLFHNIQHIYDHTFLLEPGRIDDTTFDYTGDFKDTYINRYLYNKTITTAGVYNDILCSVFFNGVYYFGHRGDVSTFTKNNNTLLHTPASLGQKIIVKFLPLKDKLYALVQDFENAYIDYKPDNLPESPKASEIKNPNSEVYTNIIPFLPTVWSVPFTKLFYKQNNDWIEDTNYTRQYGLNLIDAVSYDNNIYVLAHDRSGSGILSARYSYGESNPSGILLDYNGNLELKESFFPTLPNNDLLEYTVENDGTFKIGVDLTYPTQTSSDLNGFHEFYLYKHSISPYVVHDSVEVLYDGIDTSGIYATQIDTNYTINNYQMKNPGDQYSYRTLSITFLKNIVQKPTRTNFVYDTPQQTTIKSVNNPNIKIPIVKDFPYNIHPRFKNDKYFFRQRVEHKDSTRSDIHFITSVTHNKFIYLILQINQNIRIYCVRDFSDFAYVIPNFSSSNSNTKTVFGNTSYVGIKTGLNYLESTNNIFFLDFVPCELSNTIMTEIDFKFIIGTDTNIFVLGDGDDMFIQKPRSKNYKHNKRYATHSTMSVGGSLYVPLTARSKHPTGRLYTFVLGFFNDGSVGLVDKENVPIQIMNRPTGRTQCVYNNGKYIISSIGIKDGEPEYLKYSDIINNSTYSRIKQSISATDTFNDIYNSFSTKKWLIGEYDIKIEDNLNVRETY